MQLIQSILNRLSPGGLQQDERSQLVRGVVYSFIIQAFSVVLIFAGNYVAVRAITPHDYGVYVHVFNWISILAMLALGGQEDVAMSRIPKYREYGKYAEVAAVARHANRRVLITGLLVSLLFLLLIYFVPINTLSEHKALFLAASAAIYCTAFLTLNQTILQALNHVRKSQVVERLLRPFLFLLFVVVGVLLHKIAGAQSLVVITVINFAICTVTLAVLVLRQLQSYHPGPASRYEGKGVTQQARYFFSISILQLLVSKIGMLMMPWYLPEQEIGVFNIGFKFADLVVYSTFLLHAVLPQMFSRYHDATPEQKQALYSESVVITLVTALPLLVFNIVLGKYILHYFGEVFTAGYWALVFISISNALVGLFGPANTILMMQGKEKYAAISFLLYVLMLVGLNAWLIPLYGITGAAIALLTGHFIYNVIVAVYAWRLTGVVSPFFRFLVK